ncbi:hypothetical protein KIPB_014532, partial [Kipferlia bialata]
EVLRTTFKAAFEVAETQDQEIRNLERALSQKASITRLDSALEDAETCRAAGD